MATAISPLALRIQVSGSREGQNEVRRFAGSFDLATQKAREATVAVKGTAGSARELVMAGRRSEALENSLEETGKAASGATRRISQMATEVRGVSKDFKDLKQHAVDTFEQVHKVWNVVGAIASRGPVKLFDAVVPDSVKRNIGGGMIAGGVGLSAMLASTIKPAATKQSQMTAITALANNDEGAAQDIYKATDEASTESVFNLPDLVNAAKTLTKDRQFSTRYLTAADDLAATDPELFNPQEAARAFGRIRVGDTGEGLERLADMGLNKQDLKDKGIEFDGSGAVADKSVAGIDRLMEAIVKTIEERFGGLSKRLATTTLAGSISNMQDAIGRFATSIGESFIPALNYGANTIKAVATWFSSLPGPIKQVIAWGAALSAGILVLGGGLLIVGGTIAKMIFAWKALSFVLGLFGTTIGRVSLQILMRMIPALLSMGLAIGLVGIAIAGFYTAIAGYQDATSQSASTLIEKWGLLGQMWVRGGDALQAFMDRVGGLLDRFNILGLRSNGKAQGDEADRKNWENYNRRAKKRGEKEKTFEEFIGDANGDEYKAAPKKPGGDLTKLQSGWDASRSKVTVANDANASLAVGGMSSPLAVGTAEAQLRSMQGADVQSTQSSVDSLQAQIYALEDQKRGASKEAKEAISAQLVEKRRQLAAARRELSAQKSLSGKAERAAAKAEREEKRRGDLYEKDARGIDKINSDNRYNEQIDDLQDELEKAREASDASRVRALTVQIAQMTARREYDEAIISARDEEDAVHRKGLEAQAKAKFDYANGRGAQRAGQKAFNQTDGSGKPKGLSQAQIRAIFNATGAQMVGPGGFGALNPGANSGDRFAGLEPSLYGASGSGFVSGVPGLGGFNTRKDDESLRKERRIRVKAMQKSNGGIKLSFKVDDVELPYQGIAGVGFE